jgi:hypothetical protein
LKAIILILRLQPPITQHTRVQLIAKILAFYFLLGSFFPKTDFGQLITLPDLYQHFQEHRQEAFSSGQDFSVWDFLQNHFLDTNSHEDNRHNDLPLKSIQSVMTFYLTKLLVNPTVTTDTDPPLPSFQLDLISLDLSKFLLRPPIA